ncbi:MAG: ATP-binding protein [Nitrospiraceae bacterium]|nr:ATP-binding protein [Nitrospiraceae bacterium]
MVKFRKSRHSLAGKLIFTVGILMTMGSLLFGYLFIDYEKEVMLKNLINYAASSTDLIKKGIQYGMLTGRKDVIQQNVDVIGMGGNIQFIRIFGPDGKVKYASNKADIGKVPISSNQFEEMESYPATSRILGRGSEKMLLYTMPVFNEARCFSAQCHFHSPDQKVLAVIEAGFNTKEVDYLIRQNRVATVFLGGLFVAVISVFLCMILYKFVSKPVALMEEGMKRIAKGNLDEPIEINTKDEMGLLANTFNSMTQDLKRYRQDMENWTRTLEDEVKRKTEEIMRAQDELINAEKLASLGRMAAGVAHELNSPLTGIVTFAHLLKGQTPAGNAQQHEDLQVIIDQANRCSKIIKGLLGFSRRTGFEMVEMNINGLIEATVSMVSHQARFLNVHFNMDLSPSVPSIMADPNQIQQVFLNMLINAADAMSEKGTITISTKSVKAEDRDFLEITFSDTGPGIPEDHISKIFEPFFTTKPVGKGTGLGLSVSYGIIKKHGGDIIVKNGPDKGASFIIRMPVQRKGAQ